MQERHGGQDSSHGFRLIAPDITTSMPASCPAKKHAYGNDFLKACSLSLSTNALCYTPGVLSAEHTILPARCQAPTSAVLAGYAAFGTISSVKP